VLLKALLLFSSSSALGTQSIAGYTFNDQQVFGPALLRICNDTLSGIHLVWKDANSEPLYNFLPRGAESWRWTGGTRVFSRHVSLGNMDWSPVEVVPYISGFFLADRRHQAICALDRGTGLGDFLSFTLDWDQDVKWNLGSISYDGGRQFAELRGDSLGSHRTFIGLCLGKVGPFPSHNLSASKTNGMLAIFWTRNDGVNDGDLYLRRSTNNGYSWRDTTVPSRLIPDSSRNTYLGASGIHDQLGNLHIAANTYDGSNRYAAAIWHYSPADTPPWSLVRRVRADSTAGAITDEALVCGRPTIAERPATGELFMVWEEFDPGNLEPATGFLRADIWAAKSIDQGRTWDEPIRITEPDRTSKRYPCVAALADSSLHVMFLIDSVSGFAAEGQGPTTNNPVAYLRVPASLIPSAVTEPSAHGTIPLFGLSVTPSLSRASQPILIRASLPAALPSCLTISDITGRTVAQWRLRGSGRVLWHGTDSQGGSASPGVYLCRLTARGVSLTRRLIRL